MDVLKILISVCEILLNQFLLPKFLKHVFEYLRIVNFEFAYSGLQNLSTSQKFRDHPLFEIKVEDSRKVQNKFERLKIFFVEFAAKSWHNSYLLRENFVTTLSIRNIKVEDYYEDYYTNLDWKLCPIASELKKEPKKIWASDTKLI